jgi:outer membrane protein OmpA-like peptidoglycan-associated protein
MVNSERRFRTLGVLLLAGGLGLTGCATKKFVRQEVATLDPKIAEVRNANTENRERIDAVDKRAQTGIQTASTAAAAADTKATQAGQAAATADQKATTAGQQAQTANQGVQTANNRINTVESRIASLDVYTAGQPEAVMFKMNSTTLSDEAKATLDTIAGQISGQRSGYAVEIQGFTDASGDEGYNVSLSQRRAEAVVRYLVSKNVPLYRISILGLGEVNPVGDNKTRAGREQNRRVEIRVLRAGGAAATN